MKIILASNSPRRKELLNQIGIEFEIVVSNIEEKADIAKGINEYVKELSYIKAKSVYNATEGERIVIGADTVVSFNNEILGKPKDEKHAFQMLKKLQGNMCEVYTGLCVINSVKERKDVIYDSCRVYIQEMTDEEINEYINTGEPMDKAGAFAIQGIGAKYITKIEGDYYSVVGLPINKLYNLMR